MGTRRAAGLLLFRSRCICCILFFLFSFCAYACAWSVFDPGACAPTSAYREIFSEIGYKSFDSIKIDGDMGPAANGFRLMVAKK